MDLLEKMNEAINYIEENITDDMDYRKVARLVYCSEHHFKRMFSFITGVTLSEYIRRRRLTLAALELKNSNPRVIDVALKYGYNSPDSFSRAFQSMHGVTPSFAKKNDIVLKAYPPMTFPLTIKGGMEMNYRIVQKEGFTIVGLKETVDNSAGVFEPQIWEELNEEIYQKLDQLANTDFAGILHVSANITDEKLDYYVAVATTKEPPQGFAKLSIPVNTWAVFEANGPTPESMLTTWERIYTEWFPTSGYEVAEAPEFVRSSNDDEAKSEIWIPVISNSPEIIP